MNEDIKNRFTSKTASVIYKLVIIYVMAFSSIIIIKNIEVLVKSDLRDFIPALGIFTIVLLLFALLLRVNNEEKTYPIIIVLLSSFSRLSFILAVKTPISADFLLLYNAAADVVSGDHHWLDQLFFQLWGYEIPFVYYEAIILKLFGSELVLKLLNAAFMAGTNLLIYLLAKEFSSPKAAFAAASLYAVYPAPILLSTVLTNQHISLFFFLLGIFFLFVKQSWSRTLAAGLFLCIGNLMRPEGIIIITALILYALYLRLKLNDAEKNQAIKKIIAAAFCYILFMQVAAYSFRVSGMAQNSIYNNCPEWKIVLGLDAEAKGLYNNKNMHITFITDTAVRRKETAKAILDSFKGQGDLLHFFGEKAGFMWGNMDTASWSLSHISKNMPLWEFNQDLTYDRIIRFIQLFEKVIYMAVFIAFVVTCSAMLRRPSLFQPKTFFFVLLICVDISVYLLIEIQTRYRYFIMPSFFVMTVMMIDFFMKIRASK